ncbi:MAG: glycosyltransferase family 2 protein [Desulfuromonadales bacterium]|nr:glycosyltransferase family 2 protein [Desulfuromonadales bacterium]
MALCVPTRNAAAVAGPFLEGLSTQTLVDFDRLLIDSSSEDDTCHLFASAGFRIHQIPREIFDHGGTRQMAADLCGEADFLIFMTQDAVLAHPEALEALLGCFSDRRVGAAYGRQLPRPGAHPIEAHARLFNYPPQSRLKSLADRAEFGIKTAFFSDSFAAYRVQALRDVGGFPVPCPVSEDTFVAARLLLADWQIAYCADAAVYHSHDFGLADELRRYYQIGLFHARQPWLRQQFGEAEGEGGRFVRSECNYLWHNAPSLLPLSALRTVVKYVGYRLGLMGKVVPARLQRLLNGR